MSDQPQQPGWGAPPPPPPPMPPPPPPQPWGAPGPPPNWQPVQPALQPRGSIGLSVVLGLVAAAVAGAAWCLVVSVTNFRIVYLALAVGWLVAQGVLAGCDKRPRIPMQIIAALITAAACVVSQYYIVYVEGGFLSALPSFSRFTDIVQRSVEHDPTSVLFWLAAVAAAFFITGNMDRSVFRPNR